MKASQQGGLRERLNNALRGLLPATTYAKFDCTGQENAGNLHLRMGNVSLTLTLAVNSRQAQLVQYLVDELRHTAWH